MDFSRRQVEFHPPDQFVPEDAFFIVILGDAVFEPEEHIMVSLNYDQAVMPKPFVSHKHESPPNSTVKPPNNERIILDHPSTRIIIQDGKLQLKALHR